MPHRNGAIGLVPAAFESPFSSVSQPLSAVFGTLLGRTRRHGSVRPLVFCRLGLDALSGDEGTNRASAFVVLPL
jgi:hypothetical protein